MQRLLGRKPAQPPIVIQDVLVGAPPGISTKQAKKPLTRQKPVIFQYEAKYTLRAGFVEPEYDLWELSKAMDTESYLRLSFDKHEELILKNQWKLVGQNPKAVEHVLTRLTEIAWSQNEPIERIIESGVEDLVEFSNVFYVVARKEGGKKYKSRFRRTLNPITGLFSPHPGSMKPFIEFNRNGTREIREWLQVQGGAIRKKFRPINVIHMPFRKKKGHIFGTPYTIPVLDDVLALRRLEELVEILTHKHAFPFFHYKIGTDDDPAREYDDGHSEVDDIKTEVSNMPFEGGLVTPHRHEIVVLSTKNKAMNAEPYVKYYEARVMSGLNLSGIDLGRGETANRSTAQTMSKGLSDRCTRFQNYYAAHFTFHVLDELIMEMGLNPTPENRVFLVFPTIDKEEERAHENHVLALYQGDLITEPEARVEIGKDPIKDDQRKDMFFERVTKPTAIIGAVDEPYTKEAKAGSAAATKSMGAKGATANREQPENKSKRLTSKPAVAANDLQMVAGRIWDSNREGMISAINGVECFHVELENELMGWVSRWLSDGLGRYREEFKPAKELYVGRNIEDAFIKDVVKPKVWEVCLAVRQHLDRMDSAEDRAALLDSLWHYVDDLCAVLPTVGESYGYARIAQVDRKKSVGWKLTDQACSRCKQLESETMPIFRFKFEDLQHHPDCVEALVVKEPELSVS